MAINTSRRDFLKVGAAAFSLACLPRKAALALLADDSAPRCALRAAVMSDVHFPGSVEAKEYRRFCRALEFMYDYSSRQEYDRCDALVVAGDMSNHGTENEIGLFRKAMDAGIRGDTRTLLCMGNHEFYGGAPELWRQVFGVETFGHYEVNGFHFLTLSPEKGTGRNGEYLHQLDWFKKELAAAEAADPEKPIFVFQHYHVTPTVYGSYPHDAWGVDDLFETLQGSPRVIDFSGHSHYPATDPRSAWQGNFTAFGTSSVSYICHSSEHGRYERYTPNKGDYSEFYIMEVFEDNSVVLYPYDLAKEEFYDFVYTVAKPGAIESYVYTDERAKTFELPRWDGTPELRVLETTGETARIEIPQATCVQPVHSYRFDLERLDSEGNWIAEDSQYVWALYFDHPVPEKVVGELKKLAPRSKYRAKVYAYNVYLRPSETAASVEFETGAAAPVEG